MRWRDATLLGHTLALDRVQCWKCRVEDSTPFGLSWQCWCSIVIIMSSRNLLNSLLHVMNSQQPAQFQRVVSTCGYQGYATKTSSYKYPKPFPTTSNYWSVCRKCYLLYSFYCTNPLACKQSWKKISNHEDIYGFLWGRHCATPSNSD